MTQYDEFSLNEIYHDKNTILRKFGKAFKTIITPAKSKDSKEAVTREIKYDKNAGEMENVKEDLNEEDYLKELKTVMEGFSKKYDKKMDQITVLYVKVNGDIGKLKKYLEGH